MRIRLIIKRFRELLVRCKITAGYSYRVISIDEQLAEFRQAYSNILVKTNLLSQQEIVSGEKLIKQWGDIKI